MSRHTKDLVVQKPQHTSRRIRRATQARKIQLSSKMPEVDFPEEVFKKLQSIQPKTPDLPCEEDDDL